MVCDGNGAVRHRYRSSYVLFFLVLLPARCAEASAMTLTVALTNCAASRSAPR